MREAVTAPRLRDFMRVFARESRAEGHVYLTGGASAVLLEWRVSTVDVDIRIIPDSDRVLRAIPAVKESLSINVELASPADFIPEIPGWQDRSPFIAREGMLYFHHYDFYSQCLSKIERAHRKDLADVRMMIASGLVERARLLEFFELIEGDLYKYPAIDPSAFRCAVETTIAAT